MRLSEWEGLATKYSSKSVCELYPAGMTPWIAICLAGQRFFSNWMPSHSYGGFAFKFFFSLPFLLQLATALYFISPLIVYCRIRFYAFFVRVFESGTVPVLGGKWALVIQWCVGVLGDSGRPRLQEVNYNLSIKSGHLWNIELETLKDSSHAKVPHKSWLTASPGLSVARLGSIGCAFIPVHTHTHSNLHTVYSTSHMKILFSSSFISIVIFHCIFLDLSLELKSVNFCVLQVYYLYHALHLFLSSKECARVVIEVFL